MPAMASRSGTRRRSMNEINMVPFIDVMLVLLIIFMVTAPMLTPSSVNVPSVGKGAKVPKTRADVIVDGQLVVGFAFLDTNVGANERFADGERADVGEGDSRDLEAGQGLRAGRERRPAQGTAQHTGKQQQLPPLKNPSEYLHR